MKPTGETPRLPARNFVRPASSRLPDDEDGLPSLADALFEGGSQRRHTNISSLERWADIMRTTAVHSHSLERRRQIFTGALQQELCTVRKIGPLRDSTTAHRYLFPGKITSVGERRSIAGILDAIEAYPHVIEEIAHFYRITSDSLRTPQRTMSFGGMLSSLQFLADPENRLVHIAPHLARGIQRVLLPARLESMGNESGMELRIRKVVDDLFAVTSHSSTLPRS